MPGAAQDGTGGTCGPHGAHGARRDPAAGGGRRAGRRDPAAGGGIRRRAAGSGGGRRAAGSGGGRRAGRRRAGSRPLTAPGRANIALYRNTTEAINAVMYSLLTEFRDGDNVVTTTMEHNSN